MIIHRIVCWSGCNMGKIIVKNGDKFKQIYLNDDSNTYRISIHADKSCNVYDFDIYQYNTLFSDDFRNSISKVCNRLYSRYLKLNWFDLREFGFIMNEKDGDLELNLNGTIETPNSLLKWM